MKTLYVGDVHFSASHEKDCEQLLHFVRNAANTKEVDRIVFLGDLNNSFGSLRTENEYFWEKWLSLLSENRQVIVITGNHDKKNQSNDSDFESSLYIFNLIDSLNLCIISSPTVFGSFAFVPYIHDKKLFVEQSNRLAEQGAKILIAHGEFDGGQYDNGFFIPDAVKQEDLNFDLIISGHIHRKSRFGKVIYVGSPRWLTSSDANQEKGLLLIDHNPETGAILSEEFIDTSQVCAPIYKIEYKEGEAEPAFVEGSKTTVELIGSSEWIKKQKVKYKGKVSLSCKFTDKSKPSNRKTGNNLEYFINNVFEPVGTDKEKMLGFMKELGIL